jgi:hypothetical protein
LVKPYLDTSITRADERIGAQAGALLANFALKTDGSAENERECEFGELDPALSRRLAKQRSKVHYALLSAMSAIRQRTGALSSK